jgi:hypothetical protein
LQKHEIMSNASWKIFRSIAPVLGLDLLNKDSNLGPAD